MKNAFSTFVFGSYERFIPYYITSIKKNYPEADIIIFYAGKLNNNVRKYLKEITEIRIILYEDFYLEKFPFIDEYKIRGGGSKTLLRFLIPGRYFENYDFVYFGDVDIILLQEEYNLFEFHEEQAVKNKLPFSNKVRSLPNKGGLSNRLTGLHFVEVERYFEKMDPLIFKFFNDHNFRSTLMNSITRDEEFLYRISMKAFHFKPADLSENKRPWHGFHLGLVRGKNYLNLKTVEENSSISLTDLKQQLTELNSKNTVNNMLLDYDCKEVYYTYKFFKLSLSSKVIVKYEYLRLKDTIIENLKKIKNG